MLSAVWLVECIGQTRVGFLASRVSNATYGAGRIEHSTSRFSRSSTSLIASRGGARGASLRPEESALDTRGPRGRPVCDKKQRKGLISS